jgi:histidinol phosphatase-like enzyme
MKKKILCFDLDGVICKTKGNDYKNSKPIIKNIKIINFLKKKGFVIKVFTARFVEDQKKMCI